MPSHSVFHNQYKIVDGITRAVMFNRSSVTTHNEWRVVRVYAPLCRIMSRKWLIALFEGDI